MFFVSNYDQELLAEERRRLWNEANGAGSFRKSQDAKSITSGLLGEQYRNQIRKSQGDISGTCWYTNEGEIGTLVFQQITDAEMRMAAYESMETKAGHVVSNYGYERGEIRGYPAMFAKSTRPDFKFAIAFIQDDWAIHAESKIIEQMINWPFNNQFPQKVEALLRHLLQHAEIEDNRSIVGAIMPKGWELVGNSVFSSRVTQKIFMETLNKNRGDISKATREFEKVVSDWGAVKLSPPVSRKQALENTRMTIERIAFESLGSFVFVGNESKEGWRFAAMLLPHDVSSEPTENADETRIP